jgi:hypothetical protein
MNLDRRASLKSAAVVVAFFNPAKLLPPFADSESVSSHKI